MTFPTSIRLNLSLKMTMLSLLTAATLSGCGVRGNLKVPPPLFGGGSTAAPERIPTDLKDDSEFDDDLDLLEEDDLGNDEKEAI